jgi:hypothetical protein
MKRFTTLTIIVAVVSLALCIPGCGGGSKSSRSGGGASTGTGTGTATGTGTDPNGTGTGTGPAGAVAVDITFSFHPTYCQVDQSFLEGYVSEVQRAANGLFKATEGQMYLNNITLKSGSDGTVVLYSTSGVSTTNGDVRSGMSGGGRIMLPGGFFTDAFLHEYCHAKFNRHTEEYSCSNCVMGVIMPTQKEHFCNTADCTAGSECWEPYILKAYPNWTNTGADPGAAPAVNAIIQ